MIPLCSSLIVALALTSFGESASVAMPQESGSRADDAPARHFVFQGRLERRAKPFSGSVRARLAMTQGPETIWTSGGSLENPPQSEEGFSVTVREGRFEIPIGSEGMTPLPETLVEADTSIRLWVWIDAGDGFELVENRIAWPRESGPSEAGRPAPIFGHEQEGEKGDEGTHADDAAEYWLSRNGLRPEGALRKARAQMQRMGGPSVQDGAIGSWEALGPGNIGGRLRAILIHPTQHDRMWIGSTGGGIWTTTNGGASWTPVSDFIASLSVTSIVMDPTNSSILYASTGEDFTLSGIQGAGIFKSTDGGTTWNQLASTDTSDFFWVTRLAHHPTQPGVLFATARSGVWLTLNGGQSWIDTQLPTLATAMDVDIHPTNPSVVFVGTQSGVYLTVNCSYSDPLTCNWQNQSTGATGKLPAGSSRCEIDLAIDSGGVLYTYAGVNVNGGEVWLSTNSGSTWNRKNTGTNYFVGAGNQGDYDNAVWVDPVDPRNIVVGGIDLWRSSNEGVTLTKISDWKDYHRGTSAHADQHVIVEHPGFNGSSNRTVFFGNDGGIQKALNVQTVSENSGWTNLANGLAVTQFYGGAAAPDGSVIVGGSQDNDHLRYRPADGANGWYQATTGDGGFAAVDYLDPATIYGEYVYLRIKKSTDGGNTYSWATTGLGDANTSALFIAPFVLDPNFSSRLVAGGSSIWLTTNRADNWSAIRGSLGNGIHCSAVDIALGNSNVIWVGYRDGTVSFTPDGGTQWANVDNGLPNRFVTDIAINPKDSAEVIVTFGGYAPDNVWITSNNGSTWDPISGSGPSGLPEIPMNSVRYHPVLSDWIYVGSELGVFASEDKGERWSISRGAVGSEGPVNTRVTELFWQGTDLIATTYGRGMFRVTPAGILFVDLTYVGPEDGSFTRPFNTVNEAIAAAANGTTIYVRGGTYSEGSVLMTTAGELRIYEGSIVIR
ncbi:MAG: hypothetical protein RL885_28070 [Planctomycetota bacterium]